MTQDDTLSFAELDRRLRAMPDGPTAILDAPPLYRIANAIGMAAFVFTLVPFVLVRIMAPAMWMVSMAQIGLAIVYLAWLPYIARQCGVMGWTLWRWRQDQVEQLDHDAPHFSAIVAWLRVQSESALVDRQRMVGIAHRQLTAKIGFLAGGLDRLGVLPVLVSAYLFLRNGNDLLDMPVWQIGVAVFLCVLWLITTAATLMRIRLQLYEVLLTEALALRSNALPVRTP